MYPAPVSFHSFFQNSAFFPKSIKAPSEGLSWGRRLDAKYCPRPAPTSFPQKRRQKKKNAVSRRNFFFFQVPFFCDERESGHAHTKRTRTLPPVDALLSKHAFSMKMSCLTCISAVSSGPDSYLWTVQPSKNAPKVHSLRDKETLSEPLSNTDLILRFCRGSPVSFVSESFLEGGGAPKTLCVKETATRVGLVVPDRRPAHFCSGSSSLGSELRKRGASSQDCRKGNICPGPLFLKKMAE